MTSYLAVGGVQGTELGQRCEALLQSLRLKVVQGSAGQLVPQRLPTHGRRTENKNDNNKELCRNPIKEEIGRRRETTRKRRRRMNNGRREEKRGKRQKGHGKIKREK